MGWMDDKTVLVVGAGSIAEGWGNGKAAAVAYAREGARVACADRDRDAAAETVRIIRDEGGEAEALTMDVLDTASVAEGVAGTMRRWERLDVLHNNVGTNVPGGMEDADEAGWRHVMDVNLTSVFRTCKAVLPIMVVQGSGAIVNVSSIAAIRWTGYPYVSYMASKAGLNQLTRAIAAEYAGRGIRANTIMPGLMDTPHVAQSIARYHGDPQEMAAKRASSVPMGRQGDAWDVAWASVFLASDRARFITGVELPVDGGQSFTMMG